MGLRFGKLFGIRFKLVFLSSFLLIIPWIGYRFILEMEGYLSRGQEEVVLGTARGLATALNERPELFDEAHYSPARRSNDLYVYPIYYPLALDDGNVLDWREYQQYEVAYDSHNYLRTPLNLARNYDKEESLRFNAMVGEYNRSLYAYFKVIDDQPVYRNPDALSLTRSDFLHIAALAPEGNEIRHFIIAPHEPEFLYPFKVNANFTNPEYENRISGQWYATEDGYEVELQIPLDMLGSKLGFAFYDVDDPALRNVETVVATSNVNSVEQLGMLLRPTPEIDRIVAGMDESGSRIQVVDRTGRVLLTVGDIQTATGTMLADEGDRQSDNRYWAYFDEKVLQPFYDRVLTKPGSDFSDDPSIDVTREGAHIDSALNGIPQTQFRTLTDAQTRILGAAHPILANGEVLGAVVVDQNMSRIQTVRNQALEDLFNTMLAVMLAVVLGLLFFASRISRRIRLLRNQAEDIIDENGRIRNTIIASGNSDEIGDLSRSFSSIVERLTQYTSYLENMSSRLSHELRTPVTVVRSSLENLGMVAANEESAIYIERADEGIRRLNAILTNMSEATRLEQMLQTTDKEKMDLAAVIRGCVEGYEMAYPDSLFEMDISGQPVWINGVPEHIAQLMDKLVANAVEFSFQGEKVQVSCHSLRDHAIVKVTNRGPYLPEEMKGRLFESMISVRPQEKQKQPHLGMGLHIARLIAEFHGGQIRAENLSNAQGVVITVVFPLFFK
jgi:dedicated sortase system histidine kinase